MLHVSKDNIKFECTIRTIGNNHKSVLYLVFTLITNLIPVLKCRAPCSF